MGFATAHSDKYLFLSPPFFSIDKKLFSCPGYTMFMFFFIIFFLVNQKLVFYLYKEISNFVNEFI
jgi:hypothetical protein